MDAFPEAVTINRILYHMVSHSEYARQLDRMPPMDLISRSVMLAERQHDGHIVYWLENPSCRTDGRIAKQRELYDPPGYEPPIYNEDTVKIYVSAPGLGAAAHAAAGIFSTGHAVPSPARGGGAAAPASAAVGGAGGGGAAAPASAAVGGAGGGGAAAPASAVAKDNFVGIINPNGSMALGIPTSKLNSYTPNHIKKRSRKYRNNRSRKNHKNRSRKRRTH